MNFPEIQLLSAHQHTTVCLLSQLQTLWDRGKILRISTSIGPASRDHSLRSCALKGEEAFVFGLLLMNRLPLYISSPDTLLASIPEDITV